MLRNYRVLAITLALASVIVIAGSANAKGGKSAQAHVRHSHSGQKLLGNRIHTDGPHVIDKVGKNTVTAVVKNGKIAGVKVKHSQKGEVAVTKYKTKSTEQLGRAGGAVITFASYDPQLAQDGGYTWIGYSFIDDYGDEQIYWFPYDEVYDPETGAVLYVPAQ